MIDIEKMSCDEIMELELLIQKRIRQQALKSFDEVLAFIRCSNEEEVIIDIQDTNDLAKMIEFINISSNQSEKNEIVKILNKMGYDIRSYLMKYNCSAFDGHPNYEKIKDRFCIRTS